MAAVDDDNVSCPLPTTNPVPPPHPHSRVHSAVYIVVWISLGSTVILFNKWILDPEATNFQFPIFLTTWHLMFSTIATQVLARTSTLLDGRKKVRMTGKVYLRTIFPVGLLYSLSLISGNKAYQYLSVSFIQMLKATTPVGVLLAGWCLAVEKPNLRTLRNILFIVIGVIIASYGEILFNTTGFAYQVFGNIFEAFRLVLVQRLLSSAEHKMDPLVSLYYFAPVCATLNFSFFLIFESRHLLVSDLMRVGSTVFVLNALVAFALNVSSVFLIGRTSSLVLTLCGVLKDILLVCASILFFGTPISGLQLIGYSIALVALLYYKLGIDRPGGEYTQVHGSSLRSPTLRKLAVGAGFLLVLLALGGMYGGYRPVDNSKTVHGSMPVQLAQNGHLAYRGGRKFDIVVSMYQENQTKIAEELREIKNLSPLQGLEPNIIIYVKDQEVDAEALKKAVGADVVKIIPNKGREGGTYLTHILDEWDNLATHTLFLQGDIHKFSQLSARITDYFFPGTGVLSLGFGYSSCSCDNCQDEWGGDDVWYRVPEVYSAVTGELCPTSKILMSYGGQFIASSNRIRSTEKHVYEHIKQLLESDKEHWIHEDSKMGRFNDKVDNPYFGHTLERSWMILFQCFDPRLSATCPKLDSRRGLDDTDETCQCVDRV